MVGCSAVLADKEFQNLSVTAHNWVDIVEVKPEDLVTATQNLFLNRTEQ